MDFAEIVTCFRHHDSDKLRAYALGALESGEFTSILHPLGFILTPLGEKDGATLRMHLWERERLSQGSALTPYHDHVWSLSSCVLDGVVKNTLLDIVPDQNGAYTVQTVFQDKSRSEDRVGVGGDRVKFVVQREDVIRTDEFYQIAPRQFHFSSLAEGDRALTLVLSEPGVSGDPRTLMPVESDPHAPVRRTIGDIDEVRVLQIRLLRA